MLSGVDDLGMVLYTDGGCGPTNPGFMGFGIHGYLYKDETPKKGAGLSSHVLTCTGYISKSRANKDTKQITPIYYFDGIGSSFNHGTNNLAELSAALMGIRKAVEYNLKKVVLIADSEYLLNGLTDKADNWIRNNWMRDGVEIPNAAIWKELVSSWHTLANRGVKLEVYWVRGHGDGTDNSFGNIMADKLATIGKAYSTNVKIKNFFKESNAEGYWKPDVEKHPLLCLRSLYFSTNKNTHFPGEYYIGNQSKEDELLGKKISNGAYGVVQLKEPDSVLEFLRDYQSNNVGEYERLIKGQLDNIFNTDNYNQLDDHREFILSKYKPGGADVRNAVTKAPILDVLHPPLIATRAFDCIADLKTLLEAHKSGNASSLTYTNITDLLYNKEEVTKKNNVETKLHLKPEFNVGFSTLKLKVNVTPKGQETLLLPITLTLNIDIPDRNTLKRLEDPTTNVYVITWSNSPESFHYATIIEYKEDKSIWCGYYSNLVFITDKLKSM